MNDDHETRNPSDEQGGEVKFPRSASVTLSVTLILTSLVLFVGGIVMFLDAANLSKKVDQFSKDLGIQP